MKYTSLYVDFFVWLYVFCDCSIKWHFFIIYQGFSVDKRHKTRKASMWFIYPFQCVYLGKREMFLKWKCCSCGLNTNCAACLRDVHIIFKDLQISKYNQIYTTKLKRNYSYGTNDVTTIAFLWVNNFQQPHFK